MRSISFPATIFLCVALASLLQAAPEPERVRIPTADYVSLHGMYYPGDKGFKSPAAIMLLPVGSSTTLEQAGTGWSELAKKLQAKGFSVLAFDYRGFGNSTDIQKEFWTADPVNSTLKGARSAKTKTVITYTDFRTPTHVASLENDIAAAKRFLDTRNDAGDCNSARLIVIGAGSGAALGNVWIYNEWNRRAIKTGATFNSNRVEGQDIAGAVWLSMTPNVVIGNARWNPHLETYLGSAMRDKVPMLFLYGDQDTAASKTAKNYHSLMMKGKEKKVRDLTKSTPIKDTKLAGVELLGKPSLQTEDLIVNWATKVVDERAGAVPHDRKDVEHTAFPIFPTAKYVR